jgi:hypothetical protein
MTESSRRTLYRVLSVSAGLLYAWGLGALWFAHEWAIPESRFLFVGILPVVAGVVLMVWALQLHTELVDEDTESEASSEPSESTPKSTPKSARDSSPRP